VAEVKVVDQEIVSVTFWPEDPVAACAGAARTCYQSHCQQSEEAFLRRLIKQGHESVIEHAGMTVRLITDRGITHELVRHRLASYSQESTRYCNYTASRFGDGITVIRPTGIAPDSEAAAVIRAACEAADTAYAKLIDMGVSPQIARAVLPTCLKTEIVVTANLREWRHVFSLRCDKAAHPQMCALMRELLRRAWEHLPWAFFDLAARYLTEDDDIRNQPKSDHAPLTFP